eukprot:TRINITY_DN1352_c0_g1_i4.p1 TRINITY_DN1352_c0_g1~~TRINITY_DN1352_c0_g1_i4.p1  ORF type:complete len:186 (-),score=8.12 TRINITY_DN1352_c0_g1_i4:117-674(-)
MSVRLRNSGRLAPEVNRVLYVRNLPFKITADEMYDIFGKYGAIRQIRVGINNDTRGTAFVVYEDIFDAKNAVEHLSGFNVGGRYEFISCSCTVFLTLPVKCSPCPDTYPTPTYPTCAQVPDCTVLSTNQNGKETRSFCSSSRDSKFKAAIWCTWDVMTCAALWQADDTPLVILLMLFVSYIPFSP